MKLFLTIFDPSEPPCTSQVCTEFIKGLTKRGQQATAERIFARTLAAIQRQRPCDDPVEICERAVEYCKPIVEVRSQRRDGVIYQVPTELDAERQQTLAIRWLLAEARAKGGRPMSQRLANEMIAACRRGPHSPKRS